MTVTLDKATDTVSTAPPSHAATVLAADLRRVLANAALFADTPRNGLPALVAVLVHTNLGVLTATATDRYALGRDTAPAGGADLPLMGFPLDFAKRIIAACKGTAGEARITVEGSLVTVTVATTEIRDWVALDGFPSVHALLDKREQWAGTGDATVTVDPKRLAPFTKVVGVKDYGTVLMRLSIGNTDRGSNAVLIRIGDRFTGMLMPVREQQ